MASAMPLSSVSVLGAHIAALRRQADHLEEAGRLCEPAYSQAIGEADTLTEQVMTMRPVTLADAGTLALCAALEVNRLNEFEVPREDAQPVYERLLVAMRGILLVLRDAGVPLDELGPIECGYEIGRSFPTYAKAGAA